VVTAVKTLGNIPLKRVMLGDEYLEIVKHPRFGHGRGMNPCIDCRIMKIRRAGEYMKTIGASFLFTGEVLGQRPMSQHRQAIEIIDRESGYQGYILRPLSAGYFRPTIVEKEGLVDRNRLLGISGRSRKTQMSIAAAKGIRDYPCPSGGCLLTDKHFAERMKDYFSHCAKPTMRDIPLLKVGRHFRLSNGDKIIVGRNEKECKTLLNLAGSNDHLLVPYDFSGPSVILQGNDVQAAVDKLIYYTKRAIGPEDRLSHTHGRRTTLILATPTRGEIVG